MFLTKRQRIVITSFLLSISLYFFPFASIETRIWLLVAIVGASYVFSVWSIFRDVSGFEFLTLFILPTFLTVSFAVFIFQFEPTNQVRLLLSLVYGVVMYIILLSENIFNVSAERNIPLIRAANTVSYLGTLFVSFVIFSLLFGLGLDFWMFSIAVTFIGVLLFTQSLWKSELEETPSPNLTVSSFVSGVVLGEIALALSFWPLNPAKVGLALTAAVYVLLGILQHQMKDDLKKTTILEYLFVATAVFLFLVVTTGWRG
jgi:hypothetical protein